MAWIIIKSAGDEHSFTHAFVDEPRIGHKYDYAVKLADKVTAAMRFSGLDEEFLERILSYLESFDDVDDYRGDTWKSYQLKRDINQLIDILGLPEERKQRIY